MIDPADELIWSQKYRPQRVADIVLPEATKRSFQKFVDDKRVPNLLLSGKPGTGKTTAAIAMLRELDCDYIKINGSLNAGIDVLRTDIANFASSVSFAGGHKYVIIDESDYLSASNVQPALRSFMEDFSANCGFIFTCNFKHRIIEPLRSRLSQVDFVIEKSDRPKLAAQFFKRVIHILKTEGVEFDPAVVAKVIEKFFPDFRRTLGELQRYAASGRIDSGIFLDVAQESVDQLFELLKAKQFTELRKWVAVNSDQDANELFRRIFDAGLSRVELKTQPAFVTILADYMYKHAFVADPEINLIACCAELMMELSFT